MDIPLDAREQRIIIIAGVFVIAVVLIFAAVSALVDLQTEPGIDRTDRQVYYLGSSGNTELILNQLEKGTSNVHRLNDLSLVPSIEASSMLIIDGEWVGNPNATMSKTAAAINPLIFNGTPVIVFDDSDLLIQLAIEGENLSDVRVAKDSVAPAFGIFYDTTLNATSSLIMQLEGDHDKALRTTVANCYNWASDCIGGTQIP